MLRVLILILWVQACTKSDTQNAVYPWLGVEREVPPLVFDYEQQLEFLPQGDDMISRLCFQVDTNSLSEYDRVRQYFCQENYEPIDSLKSLQSALGLAIPDSLSPDIGSNGKLGVSPGWAITGHSTSLVSRFVSPINPRVILFSALNEDGSVAEDYVSMGFVRGDQFVEIVSREPRTGSLKFFLIAFKQACNTDHSCDIKDLQTELVENNWTSINVIEDSFLSNTVFDCTHCHQADGLLEDKKLRLQEGNAPFLHFFQSEGLGEDLVASFTDFHGTNYDLGGIPSELLPYSSPQGLKDFLDATESLDSRNSFDSELIILEVQGSLPGETWLAGWNAYRGGDFIPFPSWKNNILDLEETESLKASWQAWRDGSSDDLPDLRLSIDDQLGPTMGHRAATGASAEELLKAACQRCHNSKLDPNLGKSLFQVDLDSIDRNEVEVAIERLELHKNDASSPLAMPPRLFMDLSDSEVDLLIDFLKEDKGIED